MKLKGLDALNNVIEQFFVELGYPEIECFMDMDFAYYIDSNEISYTLIEMPLADIGFKQFLNDNYKNIPECSLFVISLLHELGHHITLPLINNEIKSKCKIEKKKLDTLIEDTSKNTIKRQITYCNIFDEKIATDKAIEILKANYDYILEFENTWYNAVIDFYFKNNLLSD